MSNHDKAPRVMEVYQKKKPCKNLQGPSMSNLGLEGKGRGETGGRTYGET